MPSPAPRKADSVVAEPRGVGFAPIDAARAPRIPAPGQSIEFYKSHSLAARNWGALLATGPPLREVTVEEAQATVLRNLLDTPLAMEQRKPLEWSLSVLIHVGIVAALIIAPVVFTQALDSTDLRSAIYLSMPLPPAAPPPPPPQLPARHLFRQIASAALTVPTAIPKKVVEVKDIDAPDVGGGVAGGEAGGALGGILGGVSNGPAPPPAPPAAPAKKGVARVGGDVKPPRQIVRVAPDYPIIAQKGRVEGVVEVDALIDEQGNVVEAHAVSGPGLLMPAAVKAVMKWKYEPTYLDGVAVSIEMKVEVSFHLHEN